MPRASASASSKRRFSSGATARRASPEPTRATPPDRFLALKIEHLERQRLKDGPDLVIWGAGKIGKRWARALRARGHAVKAFVEVDPRKIGQRIHGAVVVGVEAVRATAPALHLAAVGQPGARTRIRAEAARLGHSSRGPRGRRLRPGPPLV